MQAKFFSLKCRQVLELSSENTDQHNRNIKTSKISSFNNAILYNVVVLHPVFKWKRQ